jgi:hypothetical protein
MMSYPARRELLARVAGRYREANHAQKTTILDEFVAATGYARKYAIRLLTQPVAPSAAPVQRPRSRAYGPAVQEALAAAWAAANFICGKRLVPFLPQLVAALERHGHLTLTDEVRGQLMAISPASADRLLQPLRQADNPRGRGTTRAGGLLKHQIPIRTFADWEENRPGFMEADLVAHCGGSVHGTFLNTLVLTDIATGWTECLPLLYRSQEEVLQALGRARRLLPFPLLGLDTDNGTEFLNAQLLAYCRREAITFTRGRAHKSNDQCHVEQKNGTIVRQLVGYDRYEGQQAYRQLTELYRAMRLYINYFQPSMKLVSKERHGAKVAKRYDQARTPHQRLLAAAVLREEERQRLAATYEALDPIALRQQMETLQRAFWRHAFAAQMVGRERQEAVPEGAPSSNRDVTISREIASVAAGWQEQSERRYRRLGKARVPHTWRTRKDPFEEAWAEIEQWLAEEPERTAKSLLRQLQERHPGQYGAGQLRTLQRRVKEWRKEAIIQFNEEWLDQERISGELLGEEATVPVDSLSGQITDERLISIEEIDRLMTVGSCVV